MRNLILSTIEVGPGESKVQSNLALTPAQMEQMTFQGRAIASQSLELFAQYPRLPLQDGLPLEFRRGVDINTAWEAQQVAREKVSSVGSQLSAAKL